MISADCHMTRAVISCFHHEKLMDASKIQNKRLVSVLIYDKDFWSTLSLRCLVLIYEFTISQFC